MPSECRGAARLHGTMARIYPCLHKGGRMAEQPVVLDPLSGLLQQSRSTARLPESSLYLIMQSHRP